MPVVISESRWFEFRAEMEAVAVGCDGHYHSPMALRAFVFIAGAIFTLNCRREHPTPSAEQVAAAMIRQQAAEREQGIARVRTTEQGIDLLRSSVRLYKNDHPGQCPTTEQLQAEGFLDRSRATTDGWGRPFHVECNGDDVVVRSDGPDGRAGTEDDIPR